LTVRILMVDDEPDAEELFRQNFRREVRKDRYELLFAQSGEAALDLLQEGDAPSILVLLSDINMPGMKGTELLQRVKNQWSDLPVIMITAYGDPGTEAEVKALGAERLVAKPVDFSHLKAEIASLAQAGRT
jgi:CheY-like chemotaxis protein